MTVLHLDPVQREFIEALEEMLVEARAGRLVGVLAITVDDEESHDPVILGDFDPDKAYRALHGLAKIVDEEGEDL